MTCWSAPTVSTTSSMTARRPSVVSFTGTLPPAATSVNIRSSFHECNHQSGRARGGREHCAKQPLRECPNSPATVTWANTPEWRGLRDSGVSLSPQRYGRFRERSGSGAWRAWSCRCRGGRTWPPACHDRARLGPVRYCFSVGGRPATGSWGPRGTCGRGSVTSAAGSPPARPCPFDRRNRPTVPLYRTGDLDDLTASADIDWDAVRCTPAGRRSPLAALSSPPGRPR